MASSDRVSFVTCIYDIGRSRVDARSIVDYAAWLNRTISIFPRLIIFYEDEKIRTLINQDAQWIKLPFSEFQLSNHILEISEICGAFSKYSSDITFKLPEYSILQFQKFRFLEIASDYHEDSVGFFWIDAGISRFLDEKLQFSNVPSLENSFVNSKISKESFFEIDLRKNRTILGKIRKTKVGTCKRVFAGGAFYLTRSDVSEYRRLIDNLVFTWIKEKRWDNEQIALNQLFTSKKIFPQLVTYTNANRTVTGIFLGIEFPKFLSRDSLKYRILQGF
jgi:hypothetical protein